MKIIKHIETVFFCMVLLLFMIMAVGTLGAGALAKICGTNNEVITYLTKNVTIQAHITDDRWSIEYPRTENFAERYVRKFSEIKRVIDSCCTESFPWSIDINNAVSRYKKDVLGYDLDAISSPYEADMYVQEPSANVLAFAEALENEGYPFLYVQMPAKDSVIYCQGREGELTQIRRLERSRAFVSKMEALPIRMLDMAKEPGLSMQYDSSGHWSPKDGLLCARAIAAELNENYGFDFDMKDYDILHYKDLMERYPEDVKEIEKSCGYVFELLIPDKETAYTVTYAEDISWEGNFQETLVKPEEEWDCEGDAYHGVFRIVNSLMYEIHNEKSARNKGKKILVIGDSFNWPVSSYLSVGVEDIVVMHNASFTGSLMAYIQQMKPDVVCIAYSDIEFDDVYTVEAFAFE